MTIESLVQDLESAFEGDNNNSLWIQYKNGKVVSREIRPKRKPYAWENK